MTRMFTLLAAILPFWLFGQGTSPSIDMDAIARDYLQTHYSEWHLSRNDIAEIALQRKVFTKHNDVTTLYYNQQFNGINLENAIYNVSILPSGKVLIANNRFYSNLAGRIKAGSIQTDVNDALQAAFNEFDIHTERHSQKLQNGYRFRFDKGEVAVVDYEAELQYSPQGKALIPVWSVTVMPKGKDLWNVKVDASTGQVLSKRDMTVHCEFEPGQFKRQNRSCSEMEEVSQEAMAGDGSSYRVFPYYTESPIYGGRELLTEPADPAASPYGWHDVNGADGAEYTITRGNNTHAYLDLTDSGLSAGDEPDGGASLTFDFAYDPNAEASVNRDASVVNLFYMNNFMHDFSFAYGFDEQSGNYQAKNYGGGPNFMANDYVLAQGQDGSGTNNANFSAPTDGINGQMQMYVWVGQGARYLTIWSPGSISGTYRTGVADFGQQVTDVPVTGDLVIIDDGSATFPHQGCNPTSQDLTGKIALVDRGTCYFAEKAIVAQDAGAIGIVIANYENNIIGMTAPSDLAPLVTIPVVMITSEDANTIRNKINDGETVNGSIVLNQTNGPDSLDSGFDNGVIAHEFGHGISIRLTGGGQNSSCLFNDEQMGEGWSDFFTLVTSAKSTDTGAEARGIGNYVNGDSPDGPGIRRYPYSTDMSINPLTYYDILNTTAPHPLGEVWTACLWDLYWALVDKYGFDSDVLHGSGGNNIAVQLVMDGMKMQACSPGFVDGRDAILAADMADNGGANQCLIWEVFARRGLGASASQGSSDDRNDGKEAYDTPRSCRKELYVEKSMTPVIDAGDEITVTLDVYNYSGNTATSVVLTDEIPAGTEFVQGSASVTPTVSGQTVSFDLGEVPNETNMTITYKLSSPTNMKSTALFYDDLEAGEDNWIADGTTGDNFWDWEGSDFLGYAHSGVKSFYIEGTDGASNQVLYMANPVHISADKPILRFFHQFGTKPGEDGGIVEISTDGGTVWHDLGDKIFRKKYTGKISYSTFVIPNLKAFWGQSDGFQANEYIETMVDLSDYAGQNVLIQFHFATGSNDTDEPSNRWVVDDIELMDMINYNGEACISADGGIQNCTTAPEKGTVVNSNHIVAATNPEELGFNLLVHPNPAHDIVNVQIDSDVAQPADLMLTGVDGKMIQTQSLNLHAGSQVLALPVDHLRAGMYFVHLRTAKGVSVQKLLVK